MTRIADAGDDDGRTGGLPVNHTRKTLRRRASVASDKIPTTVAEEVVSMPPQGGRSDPSHSVGTLTLCGGMR
jgi:hypothetical protein